MADAASAQPEIILTFDVEEHFRIEAAAGIVIEPPLRKHYCDRLLPSVQWILDQLEHLPGRATFFVVGQIARDNPAVVRAIHRAGHEVGSHSWEHKRVHLFDPESFRVDLRTSKDALEQVIGEKLVGFRAPTFSITAETAWAIDILVEEGFLYDSSIYPVRHDRYGVPDAPRVPFLARGSREQIIELPPATLRIGAYNLPVGGGGYFRLFPLALMDAGIRQLKSASPAMLYFHPWEFDPRQIPLPLGRLSRFRTYCGIHRSCARLVRIAKSHSFWTAKELAENLSRRSIPAYQTIPN